MLMAKILVGGAGLAAIAAITPATAQYYPRYGISTQAAVNRCAAAVDRRRNVSAVTVARVDARRNYVRVRGYASSGRLAYVPYGRYGPYGPYGVGAYGMLGHHYARPADLSFKCDVDYRGRIRDIDINRRSTYWRRY